MFHGLKVKFYGLNRHLEVDEADLASKLTPDIRVLLYIHYFGFPLEVSPELAAKVAPRTVVIEDSTDNFVETRNEGDFCSTSGNDAGDSVQARMGPRDRRGTSMFTGCNVRLPDRERGNLSPAHNLICTLRS